MDTATTQILVMGAICIAFLSFLNWLEAKEKRDAAAHKD
jgi:hypothetical protein